MQISPLQLFPKSQFVLLLYLYLNRQSLLKQLQV